MESVEKNPEDQKIQKRPNILVIEDSQPAYYRIFKLLKNDFELSLATRKREALLKIGEQDFSAFIVDLAIERKGPQDGISIIKDIRRKFPKMPILIFTKYAPELFLEEARDAGADDYLSKLKDFDRLPAKLTSLMRKKNESTGD